MLNERIEDLSENHTETHEDELEADQEKRTDYTEKIKLALGQELAVLYAKIKKKYSDKEAGWTPAKIEVHSPDTLAPIIREIREILELSGAAKPDDLISALIEFAQDEVMKGSSKEDFLMSILSHKSMTSNSAIEKFYRRIGAGLVRREEKSKERKAA